MPSSEIIRIATRNSALALWQAHHVANLIRRAWPSVTVELVEVSTTGDRVLSQPLRDFGGLGVFTREVQLVLLDGRADIAVHSLKDLPTEPHPELLLAAIPPRGLTADALVLPVNSPPGVETLAGNLPLPQGAKVATGSPRRQAQLKALRPDLQLMEVRGNVGSRLRKLDEGEFDALILACAGLDRLGLAARISQRLEAPLMYHAVGQGAIGIECRREDSRTAEILAVVNDPQTSSAAKAERALLAALRAGCHAPVGVTTRWAGDQLEMEGVVLTLDGQRRWTASAAGPGDQPAALGQQVAELLITQGAMLSS